MITITQPGAVSVMVPDDVAPTLIRGWFCTAAPVAVRRLARKYGLRGLYDWGDEGGPNLNDTGNGPRQA